LIKLSFDFSPLVLVPSKLKLALLIIMVGKKEDPRGIGINRLSGAVMYSIKSALRIMASDDN
jgi:hypothetical protein